MAAPSDAGPAAASDVTDDPRYAAAGIRATARWVASAFGAIPALAVVGSIVHAPTDQGFFAGKLWLGVIFAAAGATIGIIMYARVLSPTKVGNAQLGNAFDLSRIPGSPKPTWGELSQMLTQFRGAVGTEEAALAEAEAEAKRAAAVAADAAAAADAAQKQADQDPTDGNKARALEQWRESDAKRNESAAADGVAAAAGRNFQRWRDQFDRLESIHKDALRLRAGDVVGRRWRDAQIATIPAVGLVAIGIAFLALAPKPKPPDSTATPPQLVTLKLNDAGRTLLGCSAAVTSLQALRIGGTDDAPQVITFPSADCHAAKLLTFQTSKKPLGTVAADEAVTP